jgi:hypothetical protein
MEDGSSSPLLPQGCPPTCPPGAGVIVLGAGGGHGWASSAALGRAGKAYPPTPSCAGTMGVGAASDQALEACSRRHEGHRDVHAEAQAGRGT